LTKVDRQRLITWLHITADRGTFRISHPAFPHLWLPTIEGRLYAYYRRAGKTVRIRGALREPLLPGDDGFIDAYQAIHRAFVAPAAMAPKPRQSAAPKHSLSAAIAAYRTNHRWRQLSPVSQRNYLRRFTMLEAEMGTEQVASFDRVLAPPGVASWRSSSRQPPVHLPRPESATH